jgi:hypothetical protein
MLSSDPAGVVKTDSSSLHFSGGPRFNLKLQDVGVDHPSPDQYLSSSTTPMSESPSVLFSFLYCLIMGTRQREALRGHAVRDRYIARLAKLLVIVCVPAIFLPQLTSLSSRALYYSSQRRSSVLEYQSLASGLDAKKRSLFDCCHSQWRFLFQGNCFKLSFFGRALRTF